MLAQSIPEILLTQYKRRQHDNSRYSMRAFARDLDVSPSQLSLILSGKRGISMATAQTICQKLEFSDAERDFFLKQVQLAFARSDSAKKVAAEELKKFDLNREAFQLSQNQFAVVSDWHHIGIVQAMQLRHYEKYCKEEGEVAVLSRILNIPRFEVKEAIQRLGKIAMIVQRKHCHQPVPDFVLAKGGAPSAAIRKYHRQMIQKALVAIEVQSIEERCLQTSVLNINDEQYESICRDIRAFAHSLLKRYGHSQKSVRGKKVYAFSAQFFRLAQLS